MMTADRKRITVNLEDAVLEESKLFQILEVSPSYAFELENANRFAYSRV